MKNILLVCAAGMSTSMLVRKMEQAAEEKDEEIKIKATGGGDIKKYIDDANVLLLGPQIAYKKESYTKEFGGPEGIPVDIINMVDYGTMNGKKVLDFALELINK
ncbi:PTS sugar transporter subunit IIB [Metabacillus arenae]|uniref:PTS sugar transporter subunit IIB n=1 Tax=Metabacillus arenae TaxID=2771434 RepID=A0A926NJU3_9BACI|nr:PTS sugar transporter subunit IIB [Metabacillus arenae]MBD1382390.1 PTS sugar transporter subunit IIB [Metabacillus arenae]